MCVLLSPWILLLVLVSNMIRSRVDGVPVGRCVGWRSTPVAAAPGPRDSGIRHHYIIWTRKHHCPHPAPMGRCGGFHACAAALHRGDGDGADAAAVLWAGSSKKASLTDVARALDVRSSRGPAIGRDVDLAIRALLRRTRSKAGKKDA